MGLQVPTSHSHGASGVLLREHISFTGINPEVHSLCTSIPACLDRHKALCKCVFIVWVCCVCVCVCVRVCVCVCIVHCTLT